MPSRCCVPNCDSGYTYKKGCEENVKMFSTSDLKMQQKWTRIIPRKDYKVTRCSYVCVKHFADEDIVKGNKIVIGGKEEFIPYTKWVLKKGAVPKLFLKGPEVNKPCNKSLNCSTPSTNKRKLSGNSKEKINLPNKKKKRGENEFQDSVTIDGASKQHCTDNEIQDTDISDCMMPDAVREEACPETNLLLGEIFYSIPPAAEITSLHQCRESEDANQDMSDLIDPSDVNAGVNVQNSDAPNLQTQKDGGLQEVINWEKELSQFHCPLNWYYDKGLTEENEFHIFKISKNNGKLVVQKNIVLKTDSIDYEVNGLQVPKDFSILPKILNSIEMVKNTIAVLDELDICCGVSLKKFAECNEQQKWQLMNNTKGFEHKGVWRSYNCTTLLEPRPQKYVTEKKTNSCLECRLFKDGLNKKIWNFLNQTNVGSKLDKCRLLRAKAVRTCHRKSEMLNKVKMELNTLRTQLSQPTEEKFIEFIETLQPQAQVLLTLTP